MLTDNTAQRISQESQSRKAVAFGEGEANRCRRMPASAKPGSGALFDNDQIHFDAD